MTDRLVSSYPDVHRAFDALEPAEKTRVATRIVLWAVDEVGGDCNEVAELLSCGGRARLETICALKWRNNTSICWSAMTTDLLLGFARPAHMVLACSLPVTNLTTRSMNRFSRLINRSRSVISCECVVQCEQRKAVDDHFRPEADNLAQVKNGPKRAIEPSSK